MWKQKWGTQYFVRWESFSEAPLIKTARRPVQGKPAQDAATNPVYAAQSCDFLSVFNSDYAEAIYSTFRKQV